MADGTQIRITAVDQTTAAFRSVQSNISSLTGSLRGIAGPLAAAFSVVGISAFAKNVINLADRLQDVSMQTGVAVEQLSALGNAAKLNGADTETLNTGLVRLNRAISEATQGSEEQIKVFSALGITQEDLKNKAPVDIFYQVADAFAGAQDGAVKTDVAMKLLGRSGAELIPVLNEGSEKLRQFAGSFTTEDAKQASEFNDNLDKLIIGFQKLAITALGPVLKGLNSLFTSMAAGNKILKADTEGLVGTFEAEAGALQEALVPGIRAADEAYKDFVKSLEKVNQEVSKPVKKVIDLGEKDADRDRRIAQYAERNKNLAELFKKLERPVDTLAKELANLDSIYQEGLINIDQYLDAQMMLQEAFQDTQPKINLNDTALKKYMATIENVQDSLQNAAVNGLRSLEDALVGVYMGTLTVKEAFRNMAISIVQDLIRIQIQRSIVGPLANVLSGLFGASDTTGEALGSGISVSGRRALGGTANAGEAYMVGERGPELFIPGKTGAVVPNNQLGGSGANVYQTINIQTGVSQTVRAEVMSMLPRIMESTKAAIADSKRRGGTFGKMMA